MHPGLTPQRLMETRTFEVFELEAGDRDTWIALFALHLQLKTNLPTFRYCLVQGLRWLLNPGRWGQG
jgi:hypothetical protein